MKKFTKLLIPILALGILLNLSAVKAVEGDTENPDGTTNETSNTTPANPETQTPTEQTTPETNTSGNSTGGGNTGSQTGNTQNNAPAATNSKSNNANLSNLGIRPHDFSGFKANTTSYNVTVPKETETVEVYATAQNSKATISGTGSLSLREGLNTVSITVTAEDGTTKTYTLNIIRGTSVDSDGEQTDGATESTVGIVDGNGLANLEIEGLKSIEPKFKTSVYDYKAVYIGELTELNIKTTTTDPYYTVDIIGNEDLKEGENLITIMVSDPDGENVATYQITVDKSLVDEEEVARQKQEEEQNKKRTIAIVCIVAIIVIVILVIVIIKVRQYMQNRAVGDYDDEYDDYDDYEEDDNQDIEEETEYYEEDEDENIDEESEEYDHKPKRKGKRFK